MLVDCLTHFPSVRVAVTNIAVIRTSERAGRNVRAEASWCAMPGEDLPGILGGERTGPKY